MIHGQSLQLKSFALVGTLWLRYAGGMHVYSKTGMQHEANRSVLGESRFCLSLANYWSLCFWKVLWVQICHLEVNECFSIGGRPLIVAFFSAHYCRKASVIKPCVRWEPSEEVLFPTLPLTWNGQSRELSSIHWFWVSELPKPMGSTSLEM